MKFLLSADPVDFSGYLIGAVGALASAIVGGVIWYARNNEVQRLAHEAEKKEIRAEFRQILVEQETEHRQMLSLVQTYHAESDKQLREKIDELKISMDTLTQAVRENSRIVAK